MAAKRADGKQADHSKVSCATSNECPCSYAPQTPTAERRRSITWGKDKTLGLSPVRVVDIQF